MRLRDRVELNFTQLSSLCKIYPHLFGELERLVEATAEDAFNEGHELGYKEGFRDGQH